MDLSSFIGIRRAGETYANTRRNRSPTSGRSLSRCSSSLSTSCPSTTAQASPESSPLAGLEGKKVRFVHPVVTAVIEPKEYGKKLRFAEPLTNIPLRSIEERAALHLPGTPYKNNDGPICDNARGHYQRLCMCYEGSYTDPYEEEDAEPFQFNYDGLVYADDDAMFRGRSKDSGRAFLGGETEEDVWEEIEYGLAL